MKYRLPSLAFLFLLSIDAFCQLNIPAISWQKCIGGTATEAGYSIQQTDDGGYIMLGNAESTDGDIINHPTGDSLWIAKLSPDRNITWQTFVGEAIYYGGATLNRNIEQTVDGGYIVSGRTVTKLFASGAVDWQTPINTQLVHPSTDGGYIAVVSNNYRPNVTTVTKLNPAGATEWIDTFGVGGGMVANAVAQLQDGSYIVGGVGNQDPGPPSVCYVHIANNGSVLASPGNEGRGQIVSVTPTSDGGYVRLLTRHAYIVGIDKYGVSGNIEWSKQYAFPNSTVNHISQLSDSSFIVSGSLLPSSAAILFRVSKTGDSLWLKDFGGSANDAFNSVCPTNDGGFIAIGSTYSNDGDVSGNHGSSDIWLAKFGQFAADIEKIMPNTNIEIYPNPTTGDFTLETGAENKGYFYLYTLLGQLVASYPITEVKTEIHMVQDIMPGVYIGQFKPFDGSADTKVRIIYQNQ
ncbi:MAG: T9SS type A sorting domain-containing protein [Bacteroidetes bacterium]|nr:T9SS type A sorting domain-containing protein [Bacteroidota bacterium]